MMLADLITKFLNDLDALTDEDIPSDTPAEVGTFVFNAIAELEKAEQLIAWAKFADKSSGN